MTKEEIEGLYPYKYETHMHTSEGSACGNNTGAEMARAYKEAGYDGIIITDHAWYGNTAVDRSLPWEEWCRLFFKGYEGAYEEGQKIGLKVFPGWESGYDGTEFLVYGVTPENLAKHPEFKDATIPEQLELAHSLGGMVIQAHPFREAWYIDVARTYPEFVDGIEGVNGAHDIPGVATPKIGHDDKAIALANKYNLPMTAGSDQHSVRLMMGGVSFKTPIDSLEDFISRIKNKEDYVLSNGRAYYSNKGELLVKWKD